MYNYIVDHILKGNKRPGTKLKLETITIHNTGNPTSTARNERGWLSNPYNTSSTSFHIAIDDKEVVECIPLDEVAYHSGNKQGNLTSIGVEICESGNQEKVWDNAIKLIANLLFNRGWGVDRITTHQRWNGKNCPRLILPRWNEFINDIEKELWKLNSIREQGLSEWAIEAWEWGKEKGITDGQRPKDFATREELVTMLYRMKEIK
ncbi:N-acetylmuramoyl-L-alanine amidase [Alkaliphilus sp. MSJ-5]|uniref:N-acetylmuramoyl-L-alanine amidase n=1 Tax=Alkaliphilus flagellatus TaxID=2841507 RepID=A0ABS6G3P2_9FIRM|nr:N-acetylmuramoyl-L-alanine amidase [Alkaliphilus flagellatus]MBU5676766.1 N-acetylmuramoyl-L-alanine amidase [Alkaliphilus flagellatus]